MRKKAAAYARFSSTNQRDESIDAQLRAIRGYADDNDIEIVREYIDRAKTGTNADRENFQKMLRDSADGDFEVIIVHKLDRFARNRIDSAISRKILKDNGVKLVSVIEHFDDSPESIIIEGLMESLNEYYSANLSREVRKGMKENALDCRYTGGYVPLGYSIDDSGHYRINEDEAPIIRGIFASVLQGMSYSDIQKELSDKSVKTRTGQPFGKNSLYSILTNEKYAGVYIYNREVSKNASGKRNSHKNKPPEEIIRVEGGVPSIVTREEFDAVQEILAKRKRTKRERSDSTGTYLLTGKIFCGECGGRYCGNSQYSGRKKTLYYCYRCNVRSRKGSTVCHNREISRSCLESYVLKLLANVLFDKKRLPTIIEEYNKSILQADTNMADEKKRLRKAAHSIETEIDNIIGVIAKTGSQKLVTALESKEKELNKLNDLISELERKSAVIDIEAEQIERAFDYGRELLISGKLPHLKQLIELYVERIDIYPESVSVTLNILRGLQANESGKALDKLNRTYPKALSITETVNRSEVVTMHIKDKTAL